MIRGVLGSRASIGGVLGSGRGGAAAAWYLAGGVSAANCVAAYAPKGAASLAASYVNLANPGTYNAAPGTAPTFDTATGWIGDGATKYLTTGAPATTAAITIISRVYFGNGNSSIIGSSTDFDGYALRLNATGYLYLTKQNAVAIATDTAQLSLSTPYVVAVTFDTVSGAYAFYINGSATGSGTKSGVTLATGNILIGTNYATYQFFGGYISGLAIYNVTLDAATVAALSAAMAAL